jgi:hypothetical protein
LTALLALLTMITIGTPCTNGRAAPTLSAPVTVCLAQGTSVNLTTQIVHADGYDWRQTDAGVWIASDYLGTQAQASVLTPPPAPPSLAQTGAGSQAQPQGQTTSTLSSTLVPPPPPPLPTAGAGGPGQAQGQTTGTPASMLVPPLNPVMDQASFSATSTVTPSQVTSEIDRQALAAGLRPDCVEAIAWRESHDDPSAVNPSGARGLFGWLPEHGEWSSTPLGKSGLSVAQATVPQQIAMAVWALADGDGGGAWGQADNCRQGTTVS